jgi:hypothetical protein
MVEAFKELERLSQSFYCGAASKEDLKRWEEALMELDKNKMIRKNEKQFSALKGFCDVYHQYKRVYGFESELISDDVTHACI